eukprot:50776-Eustigmatos_ZCMA.PRE.1
MAAIETEPRPGTAWPLRPRSSSAFMTSTSVDLTAIITPSLFGRDCMSRARSVISFSPSSRLNDPATQTATYSPALCPSTASGSTPRDFHSIESAYSKAKSAGCE